MLQFIRKIEGFWKKGTGEVLSFIICLPFLIIILYLIIDVIHIGSVKERLEYTAYRAARAAVVCESLKEANKEARKVARADLEASGLNITWKAKNVAVIEMADGKGIDSLGKAGTNVDDKADNSKWEKGNFIICTINVEVKTLDPFSSGKRSESITMMIEAYDQNDGEYPWFKNL